MTYKEYQQALRKIEKKYADEKKVAEDFLKKHERLFHKGQITKEEFKKEESKADKAKENARNKASRSIEKLKINFAKENCPIKEGDIIWTDKLVMRVEKIGLAKFDFPMLKFFGLQLSKKGIPNKNQKEYPEGGIYQKDVISINGNVYEYETNKIK